VALAGLVGGGLQFLRQDVIGAGRLSSLGIDPKLLRMAETFKERWLAVGIADPAFRACKNPLAEAARSSVATLINAAETVGSGVASFTATGSAGAGLLGGLAGGSLAQATREELFKLAVLQKAGKATQNVGQAVLQA
jgi:hypothetical protein